MLMLSTYCCSWSSGNVDQHILQMVVQLYPLLCFFQSWGCNSKVLFGDLLCCLFSEPEHTWVEYLQTHVGCELVCPFFVGVVVAIECWWSELEPVSLWDAICWVWFTLLRCLCCHCFCLSLSVVRLLCVCCSVPALLLRVPQSWDQALTACCRCCCLEMPLVRQSSATM